MAEDPGSAAAGREEFLWVPEGTSGFCFLLLLDATLLTADTTVGFLSQAIVTVGTLVLMLLATVITLSVALTMGKVLLVLITLVDAVASGFFTSPVPVRSSSSSCGWSWLPELWASRTRDLSPAPLELEERRGEDLGSEVESLGSGVEGLSSVVQGLWSEVKGVWLPETFFLLLLAGA